MALPKFTHVATSKFQLNIITMRGNQILTTNFAKMNLLQKYAWSFNYNSLDNFSKHDSFFNNWSPLLTYTLPSNWGKFKDGGLFSTHNWTRIFSTTSITPSSKWSTTDFVVHLMTFSLPLAKQKSKTIRKNTAATIMPNCSLDRI